MREITQGSVVRSRRLDRVTLTETLHAPGVELPSHGHAAASLAWVLAGGFTEEIDGSAHDCGPGTLVFKRRDARHRNRYGPDGARTLLIEIPDGLRDEAGPMRSGAWPRCGLPDRVRHALRGVAGLWEGLGADAGGRSGELLLEGATLRLLGELLTWRPRASARPGAPSWLRRAQELIVADPGACSSLTALADRVGVGPDRLGRAFRRHYGTSYTDFVRSRRVSSAARRVRDSELSLLAIALESGFADQSHMTREFRRHLGVTPGSLRRR